MTNRVLQFYHNSDSVKVSRLRKTLEEWIHVASDEEWETCHDFIQWIFPNPHRSPNAPEAILSEAEFRASFQRDPVLQIKLAEAFARYRHFLGFSVRHSAYLESEDRWLFSDVGKIHAELHNCLRITRVLCCLRLAGLQPIAAKFLKTLLLLVYHQSIHVTPRTVAEWKNAGLGQDWDLRPDMECIDECQHRLLG